MFGVWINFDDCLIYGGCYNCEYVNQFGECGWIVLCYY